MNLESINWGMVGSVGTIVGLVYAMFRNLKSDIADQIKESKKDLKDLRLDLAKDVTLIRGEVNGKLNKLQDDLTDIKERLSFLEAANIYTMPSEPSAPNNRSLAAIKMHQRRRQKSEKKV